MRRVVLSAAATVEGGGGAVRDEHVDANRLRRMDRFGRSGVLAGSRALAGAGARAATPGAAPDPRFGVIVGSALGCRDAITQHARLLAAATRVEDLAPSVFAATVHSTAAGELAIAFGLGGPAETLVSGRTAGLEALALAASRVAKGDADRILVVAAEGIDGTTRAAWERENPGVTLVESAAAVLVEAEEEDSSSKREPGTALFVNAQLTFEGREDEDFLEGVGQGGVRGREGAEIERLGATGLWEIATELAQPRPRLPSRKIHRYVARDAHGSCASVTLECFS